MPGEGTASVAVQGRSDDSASSERELARRSGLGEEVSEGRSGRTHPTLTSRRRLAPCPRCRRHAMAEARRSFLVCFAWARSCIIFTWRDETPEARPT